MSYLGIVLSLSLVNNVVLTQLLGLSPLLGATRRLRSGVLLGLTVTAVATVVAFIAWALNDLVLSPLGLSFLQTIVVVAASAGVAELFDWGLRSLARPLHNSAGAFFPFVATNSAVVGISLGALTRGLGPLQSVVAGASGGAGAVIALALLATIRRRLEREWLPRPFRGTPATIIAAGLMAMAFMAFDKSFLAGLLG